MAPVYQTYWKRALAFMAGFTAVGAVFDAYGNVQTLATPPVVAVGTGLLLGALLLADGVVRRRRPSWQFPSGQRGRLTALGLLPRWFIIGAIVLLWLPRAVEFFKGRAGAGQPPASSSPVTVQADANVPAVSCRLAVLVVNAGTKEPIPFALVTLLEGGVPFQEDKTGDDGIATFPIPPGEYRAIAKGVPADGVRVNVTCPTTEVRLELLP